jgi:hypothetical protein
MTLKADELKQEVCPFFLTGYNCSEFLDSRISHIEVALGRT